MNASEDQLENCKDVGQDGSDEDLIAAFSRGSTEAFDYLFSRYKQPLFAFFRRRMEDPGQAEELTQETFLVLLRGSPGYQPRALFRTYLFAIAFKILRAHRRRAALRATLLGAQIITRKVYEPAPDAELLVRQALAKLDSADREILMLREFEQLSYAEIGTLLALPINTVRSRLFRARVALRELLAGSTASWATKFVGSEERV